MLNSYTRVPKSWGTEKVDKALNINFRSDLEAVFSFLAFSETYNAVSPESLFIKKTLVTNCVPLNQIYNKNSTVSEGALFEKLQLKMITESGLQFLHRKKISTELQLFLTSFFNKAISEKVWFEKRCWFVVS